MRTTVVVLVTSLLLASLAAEAGHVGDPRDPDLDPMDPAVTLVVHDCDDDSAFSDPSNDLASVWVGVADREADFEPEPQGEDTVLETLRLVMVHVVLGERNPVAADDVPARLFVEFEDDRNHVRGTVVESLPDPDPDPDRDPEVPKEDWRSTDSIIRVQGDSRFTINPLIIETRDVGTPSNPTPAGPNAPSDVRTYHAVTLGFRFADIFAPGAETAEAPFIIDGKWNVEVSYPDSDGVYQTGDVMPDEPAAGASTCPGYRNDDVEVEPVAPVVTNIFATPAQADRHPDTFVEFDVDMDLGGGDANRGQYTYEWTFTNGDDTFMRTGAKPKVRFANLEEVTAKVIVTDDLDLSSEEFEDPDNLVTFTNLEPTADFTIDPTTPQADEDIQFTDTSFDLEGDAVVGWSWDFGDGSPLVTTQNAVHSYVQSGAFTVVLTATDEHGASSARELRLFVCDAVDAAAKACKAPNAGPTASFAPSAAQVDAGESVTFTDQSTDRDGTVTAWFWDFGDGTTSTEQNPVHPFDRAGTYQVQLTVTDDGGLQGSRALPIRVRLVEPDPAGEQSLFPPPVASFGFAPEAPLANASITFTDTTVSETDLVSWTWFFGDGTAAGDGSTVQHVYAEAGTYRVRLTVADEFGIRDTTEQTLVVGTGQTDNDAPGVPAVFGLVLLGVLAAVRRR